MGCLVALVALISPRLAFVLMWIFSERVSIAFDSNLVALLGLIFMPWTALIYALVYAPVGGVSFFGWILVGIAFIADLSSYAAGQRARSGAE